MLVRTLSGNYLDIQRPDPDSVLLSDIILSLSHENRFNGHTVRPYSVAQHTVAMVKFGMQYDYPLTALQAMWMHDTPEFILKDVVTPLKQHIRTVYDPLTVVWEDVICDRHGNGFTGSMLRDAMKNGVKNVDEEFYRAESFVLQDNKNFSDVSFSAVQHVKTVMTLDPTTVRSEMCAQYRKLFA